MDFPDRNIHRKSRAGVLIFFTLPANLYTGTAIASRKSICNLGMHARSLSIISIGVIPMPFSCEVKKREGNWQTNKVWIIPCELVWTKEQNGDKIRQQQVKSWEKEGQPRINITVHIKLYSEIVFFFSVSRSLEYLHLSPVTMSGKATRQRSE